MAECAHVRVACACVQGVQDVQGVVWGKSAERGISECAHMGVVRVQSGPCSSE